MNPDLNKLWNKTNKLLKSGKAEKAICYLAQIIGITPMNRHARLQLALALGDAGHPTAALSIIRALADRLVHEGFLLPAIAVIREGLNRSSNDPGLLHTLKSIHIRGVHAKAGQLAIPPPMPGNKTPAPAATAETLLKLKGEERLQRVAQIGSDFPQAGATVRPLPMPLFCELNTDSFVETVKQLQYHAVPPQTHILEEGDAGDSLLILISGQVAILKQGQELARLGQASVLGEMAMITRAPRSATAVALEPVEYFELGRKELAEIAKSAPQMLQELVAYCRGRLIQNLVQTSPLFSQFDAQTRWQLIQRFQTVTFSSGQKIISRNTQGTGLYLVASGTVQVQINQPGAGVVTVASLGPGQVFGEISLIHNQPTTADVIADDTVGALVLPAQVFQQILCEFPQVRQYLESLSADRLKASRDAVAAEMQIDPDDLVVL